MPGRLGWFALGAGAYLAFTLATFPASTAYRWFAPEPVVLAGVEGTIWSGRAALGSVEAFPLRELRWQLRPAALVTGRVSARFEARLAEGFVAGEMRAGRDTFVLRELRAASGLAALRTVLPLLEGINGQVSVSLDFLELRQGWPTDLAGEVGVTGLEAAALMPANESMRVPLGNYELGFVETGGAGVLADLRDTGGPLEVSGVLELGNDRAYRLEGFVRARDSASAELIQGLQLMTEDPDASGRRAFSFSGSL